jgi:hypothetical protein
MRVIVTLLLIGFLGLSTRVDGAVITFDTDPFEGSEALSTPGRQVVGGELFVDFDIAADRIVFDSDVFPVGSLSFVNDVIGNVPATGVNLIVLRTFDNDGDAGTAFGAGNAATLIANQLTSPGAGFFVYFNSGLNLPRLVFSTDLDDPTSDLKILARFTNLVGNQAALAEFSAENFALQQVPEPALLLLLAVGAALSARRLRRRKATRA